MKRRQVACRLLLALVLVWTAGCMQKRAVLGNQILVEKVRKIVPGQTKETQIEPMFGPPDLVEFKPDGSKDYLYKYDGYTYSGVDLVVIAWRSKKPEQTKLRLKVRKGIIVDVHYEDTAGQVTTLTQ
jgi:hypothetical protein